MGGRVGGEAGGWRDYKRGRIRPPEKTSHALAHHSVACINDDVGVQPGIVGHGVQHLVGRHCPVVAAQWLGYDHGTARELTDEAAADGSGRHLPDDHHGPLCLVERFFERGAAASGGVGGDGFETTLGRQPCSGKAEQRFGYWHVDVHRARLPQHSQGQCIVHKAVAVPAVCVIMRFGQVDGLAHKPPKGVGLRQGLSVKLVDPGRRSVGRDYHQRQMLVAGFGYGGCQVEQCRARGDAHHHRHPGGLGYAESHETRRTLVGYGYARYAGALVEVVYNGGVAAARAHHGVLYAVSREQRCEYVDVFLVAIHGLLCCYSSVTVSPMTLRIVSIFASVSSHSCSSMLSVSSPPPA